MSLSPDFIRGAARLHAVLFALLASVALAQEEAPPVEEAPPAQEAPAEPAAEGTEAAPAEGAAEQAAQPEAQQPEVIPVQTGEAEAAPESQQLDTIQVTGSRIKRTDFETAQPVVVVTREDIERTGLTNIGDILQRLPAAGSALNRTFNNGGAGTTEIDLRNLGSNRVLVLVNGQRWVNGTSFANTSAVDLNTIPVSIIERVEVLKDGASAIYGSDAIAGVVNIITRKDIVGVEMGGQFQAFDDGKGLIQSYHASLGTVADKTSMFFDLNVVRQNELFAGDRAQSSVPKYGTGNTRGSIHLPKGYVIFLPNSNNESILAPLGLCPDIVAGSAINDNTGAGIQLPPQAPGVRLCQMQLIGNSQTITPATTTAEVAQNYKYVPLIPAGSEDYYNYAPSNYLLTPYGQTSLFGQIAHQINSSLTFQSQLFFGSSKTERQLADTPVLYGDLTFPPFNQVYIDATNIYNPFDQDIGRHPGFGAPGDQGIGPGLGIVTKRFTEYGPRFLSRDVKTMFLKGGFDGDFDGLGRLFSWDAGYSFANSKLTSVETGNINMERLKLALGPAVNCPSTNHPDCVPVDFFSGEGSITQPMIDYLFYNAAAEATQERQDTVFNISTEFPELSGDTFIPSPVGLAFGVTYRTEDFREQPDPFAEQGIASGNLRKRTEGGFFAREAYLELALPLLADQPYADELDLSVAGRYTEYNTFDPETTYKLGLRYKPIEDLLLRATASTAFRAPAVTELFLGATDSYPTQVDPCAGRTNDGGNLDQNCDAEGVPDTAQQLNGQILNRFVGNTDLQPEVADTFTYGLVYSPSQVPNLNIYVDYFDIDIADFIGFLDGDYIFETCYERPAGSPRPETCDFVERNPDGSVAFVRAAPFNFTSFGTKGVDVAFDYVLPLGNWIPAMAEAGVFKVAFDSQYLTEYFQCIRTATGEDACTDFTGTVTNLGNSPLPRFKANMTLQWGLDRWTASWTTRFLKGSTEPCFDGFNPSLADLGLCSDPDPNRTVDVDNSTNTFEDIFYHNVQTVYSVTEWNADVGFGVLNLFDQDPPTSYSAFANSASSSLYETWGSRQLYLKFDARF